MKMKKIILLVLAAILVVALVACGGETTTTTKAPTTTTAPQQGGNNDNSDTPGNEDDTDVPGNEDDTDTPGNDHVTGITENSIDIISGEDLDNWAIEAYNSRLNGRGCKFENHNPVPNSPWYLVFALMDCEAALGEFFFDIDAESGRAYYRDMFTWILEIDGEAYTITNFYNETRDGFIWVRMILPDNFKFAEGTHGYDVVLKICNASNNEVLYYAWFTDEEFGGAYEFALPSPIEMKPDENKGDNETLLVNGTDVVVNNGPVGSNTSELFGNVMDGDFGTKLCTKEVDTAIIFTVSDNVWSESFVLTGISIVGANDDEKRPNRTIQKFALYGSESPDAADDDWTLILSVDKSSSFGDVVNYGERYYAIENGSNFQSYKLVVLDQPLEDGKDYGLFQLSEILLYADKDSVQ